MKLLRQIKEFFEDCWWACERAYNDLKCLIRHNCTKHQWGLIKESIKSYPFDYSYFYKIQSVKLKQMYEYFKRSHITEDGDQIAKEIKWTISMLEIFNEERDLFHYDRIGKWSGFGNGNVKYVCDVKVNMKNVNRFTENIPVSIYEKFPHELYIEKARRLYFKLLMERSRGWWD